MLKKGIFHSTKEEIFWNFPQPPTVHACIRVLLANKTAKGNKHLKQLLFMDHYIKVIGPCTVVPTEEFFIDPRALRLDYNHLFVTHGHLRTW